MPIFDSARRLEELKLQKFSNLSHERLSDRLKNMAVEGAPNQLVVCKNKVLRFSIPTQELIRLKFEGQLEEHIQKRLKSQLIADLPDLKYTVEQVLRPSVNIYDEEAMTQITTAIYIEDLP